MRSSDGYLIEAVLGSGGVGTVCVARQADSGHRVALKVLNAAVSGDPVYRRRFAEEVRAARSLHHPNVVRVYGHGETADGILWMAMQYVHGTDADRELRAGRMPPQRVADIIAEVAAALDYAHAHELVHGDVKPPHFLLGQDGAVVLADFGLARGTKEQIRLRRRTASYSPRPPMRRRRCCADTRWTPAPTSTRWAARCFGS